MPTEQCNHGAGGDGVGKGGWGEVSGQKRKQVSKGTHSEACGNGERQWHLWFPSPQEKEKEKTHRRERGVQGHRSG